MLLAVIDIADQAVVLPVLALVGLSLLVARRWRVGAAWIGVSGLALGTVGLMKSLTYACGWRWNDATADWLELKSPSGHAAAAALMCGMLVTLVLGGRQPRVAVAAAVIGAGVVGIALARLHIHSPAEIVIGGAVGIAATAGFGALAGTGLHQRLDPRPLVLVAVIVAALHGLRLPAEDVIRVEAAGLIQNSVPSCAQVTAGLGEPS